MTPAQVQAAFPAARPVIEGESLLDTAKELFILPGVRLPTGLPATMAFYFRGDSLNEVKLTADVPQGQTAANVRRAEALADALKRTYGKPVTCGARQSLLAFECDWISRRAVGVDHLPGRGRPEPDARDHGARDREHRSRHAARTASSPTGARRRRGSAATPRPAKIWRGWPRASPG